MKFVLGHITAPAALLPLEMGKTTTPCSLQWRMTCDCLKGFFGGCHTVLSNLNYSITCAMW